MNRNLYKIYTIGLIICLVFMVAGIAFYVFNGIKAVNIAEISEDNIGLKQLIYGLINNREFDFELLTSIGILALIAIPIAAVIFVLIYFLIRKNYRQCLISIGVLLILILSIIAGLVQH